MLRMCLSFVDLHLFTSFLKSMDGACFLNSYLQQNRKMVFSDEYIKQHLNWLKSNPLIALLSSVVVTEVKTLKSDDLAWLRDKSDLAASHGCVRSGNSQSTDNLPGSFPHWVQSLPAPGQVKGRSWCLWSGNFPLFKTFKKWEFSGVDLVINSNFIGPKFMKRFFLWPLLCPAHCLLP